MMSLASDLPMQIEEAAIHSKSLPLTIHDLTVAYHRKPVIWDINLSIPEGKLVSIVGPNGAGKSTTFKMLSGLLKPTSGEARIAGVDLRTAASEARARLGYMAQKFSLYGDLSHTNQRITACILIQKIDFLLERIKQHLPVMLLLIDINEQI